MPVMAERVEAPYGAWDSPITAETVISAAVGLSEVRVDRLDGAAVWWSESRPEEGGRVQIVREGVDVLPEGFAARTRVHEYGGGAWAVQAGVLFFANWSDQRLYRLDPGSTLPVAITPEPEVPMGDRYADIDVAPSGEWLVCVREHHPADGGEAVFDVLAEAFVDQQAAYFSVALGQPALGQQAGDELGGRVGVHGVYRGRMSPRLMAATSLRRGVSSASSSAQRKVSGNSSSTPVAPGSASSKGIRLPSSLSGV